LIQAVFEELEMTIISFIGTQEEKGLIEVKEGELRLTGNLEYNEMYCSNEKGVAFVGKLVKTF